MSWQENEKLGCRDCLELERLGLRLPDTILINKDWSSYEICEHDEVITKIADLIVDRPFDWVKLVLLLDRRKDNIMDINHTLISKRNGLNLDSISNFNSILRSFHWILGTTLKQRRLRWIRHVQRKNGTPITKTAVHWTPEGKRKRGRPKTIWRRSVEEDQYNNTERLLVGAQSKRPQKTG